MGWECLSASLFATALARPVLDEPRSALVFSASLALSALLVPHWLGAGRARLIAGDLLRMFAWAAALLPVVDLTGRRALFGAGAFGLMASGVRRVIYRQTQDRERGGVTLDDLKISLRDRLAESTFVVGVVAGHILMLFLVAFLRTTGEQIRDAWWQVLPWLSLGGTAIFIVAVSGRTSPVVRALRAGPKGSLDDLRLGLSRARSLPGQLALVNFAVWLICLSVGVFGFRELIGWTSTDAAIVLAIGLLFAWGISFYQRAFHLTILAQVVENLRAWTNTPASAERGGTLGRRMLIDFGMPLVFTCALSLFSSIGLYRALVGNLTNPMEILALGGSFLVLVLAAGGVIVRAAGELSRPMGSLALAADKVARGELEAAVPRVDGPSEVIGLGDSIERMRGALARTIAELSSERAGLEEKVAARTAELTRTLAELKEAQAALLHRERMASLGQLVAGVAHEINNPLTAIVGTLDALSDRASDARRVFDAYRTVEPDLSEERRADLSRLRSEVDLEGALDDLSGIAAVIRRATNRAVHIVGDLRSFSRATSDRAPTQLHVGLDDTLALLDSHLRSSQVTVEKDYGDLPDVLVRANEINQIFLNLLTNALDAVATAKAARIRISTRTKENAVEIAIEDNGPGVSEGLRAKIFDPFFTTKPTGRGTGLGLSISSQIAVRHGGSLTLRETPGGGACFVLRVPI